MVDHIGGTVLRCQCLDASHSGIRLRARSAMALRKASVRAAVAPAGLLPRRRPRPGREPLGTIVRTQVRLGADEDHLELGMALDDVGSSLSVRPLRSVA